MNVYCDRLDHLIARLDVKTIAPTTACRLRRETTVPKVQQAQSRRADAGVGTNEKVAAAS